MVAFIDVIVLLVYQCDSVLKSLLIAIAGACTLCMHVSMQESASWVVIARVCECAGQEPEQVMHAYNRAAALVEDGAPPRKLVRKIYHIVWLYPDMSSSFFFGHISVWEDF